MIERRAWRFQDGILLAALVSLAIVATWRTWVEIVQWGLHSEEQSHILLAPLIAAWLVWVRRERLRFVRPRWTLLGPLAVVAGLAIGWTGIERGFLVLEHFGALVVVLGSALTVVGPSFFLKFAPAIVALLFMIPVPGQIRQQIAIPLQNITAGVAHWGMELFGVPVLRAGNVLEINEQKVAVAEACNGMRMVAALGLVSYAFVFSVPMRQSVRLIILAMSPLVAIACNVIRLVPTVLFYGYADADVAEAFHDLSGWAMLVVALGLLWLLLQLLRWIEIPIAPYAVGEE